MSRDSTVSTATGYGLRFAVALSVNRVATSVGGYGVPEPPPDYS